MSKNMFMTQISRGNKTHFAIFPENYRPGRFSGHGHTAVTAGTVLRTRARDGQDGSPDTGTVTTGTVLRTRAQ